MWAQAVSFIAGTALAFPVMEVVAYAMGGNLPSAEAWGLSGALTGLINGAITGSTLVRLLRRPVSKAVVASTSWSGER